MEDELIIDALINRDAKAFEYLLTAYEKRVYGFIYNMTNNAGAAEDLTQEVFIKVYQNLHKFNTNYSIRPWLFKIAYNTTLNYNRRNKRRVEEVEIGKAEFQGVIAEDSIQSFVIRDTLMKEIQSFKPDCRAIFILRIIDELSFDEIAALLGTSTASVKLKFYRNRKVLIDKLGKTFVEV